MIYTEKGQTLAINVYLVVMVLIIWEYVVTMAIIGKYTDIASMKAFGTSFSFCYKFSNAVMILHAPTFPSCLLNILIPLTFHFSVSTCWLGCALACFDCHFFTYIKLACIASPWRFSWSPFTNLRSPQSQVSGIPDQNASKGVFSRSPFCPPPLPADLPSFLPPFSTTSIVKAISSAADSCSLRLLGFHGTITFPPPPSTWSISSLNPILPRRNHSKSLRNKIKKSFQLEKKKWITSNLHLDYVGSPSDHWKTIKRHSIREVHSPCPPPPRSCLAYSPPWPCRGSTFSTTWPWITIYYGRHVSEWQGRCMKNSLKSCCCTAVSTQVSRPLFLSPAPVPPLNWPRPLPVHVCTPTQSPPIGNLCVKWQARNRSVYLWVK